jgi:hypothetical protein
MSHITPGWRHVAIVTEGTPVLLAGHDVWSHDWRRVELPAITVAHPSYPSQRHHMWLYDLDVEPTLRFAAGEYSNAVWGFYVPAT